MESKRVLVAAAALFAAFSSTLGCQADCPFSPISSGESEGSAFLGNPERTGLYRGQGVTKNPNFKWSTQLAGIVQGGPVSDSVRVFVVTDKGKAYCLEVETGKVIWKVDFGREGPGSAPLATESSVIFSSGDGRLHCLDKIDGRERWAFAYDRRTKALNEVPESSSSPLIVNGVVIASGGNNGYVYGLDPASGKVNWRLLTPEGVQTDIVRERETTVVIAGLDKSVRLISARDGGALPNRFNSAWPWEWRTSKGIDQTPSVEGGRLLVLGRDGKLETVSLVNTGFQGEPKPDWQWRSELGFTTRASVDEPLVVLATGGNVVSFDITSGDPLWRAEIYPRPVKFTPVTLTKEHVYLGDAEGIVWCLKRKDGCEQWRFEVGDAVGGIIVPEKEFLIFATSGGKVWCLSEKH